jgi:flagellar motor switch/type III secretory pathway protein FliN
MGREEPELVVDLSEMIVQPTENGPQPSPIPARRLQDRLAPALASVLPTGRSLVADAPEECYPAAVGGGTDACCVPLRDADGTPCGALCFPPSLATAWVERLLGGTPSARTGGPALSPLEAGLLLDIAGWMARAVSETATAAGGAEVQLDPTVTAWADALPTDDATELCRFVFREGDPATNEAADAADGPEAEDDSFDDEDGANPEADFDDAAAADSDDADEDGFSTEGAADLPPAPALVLTSRFLEPLAAADPDAQAGPVDPETFTRAVRARIEAAPVAVQAVVGTASVPLGDFLALESGDVIVLDRERGETIDLTVEGRTVLRARPVLSAGRYAADVQDLRRHARLDLAV